MGIEQAIKEAILNEAKRIGIEEGKAEGELKVQKENVFGMFAEGLPIDAIVRITKLPLATIQAWQKEI